MKIKCGVFNGITLAGMFKFQGWS